MTAVTLQSNKIVSNEVKDKLALPESSYGKKTQKPKKLKELCGQANTPAVLCFHDSAETFQSGSDEALEAVAPDTELARISTRGKSCDPCVRNSSLKAYERKCATQINDHQRKDLLLRHNLCVQGDAGLLSHAHRAAPSPD